MYDNVQGNRFETNICDAKAVVYVIDFKIDDFIFIISIQKYSTLAFNLMQFPMVMLDKKSV